MTADLHVYPFQERPEVVPHIPSSVRRLLDVGCSRGGFGSGLRRLRPALELVGIEANAGAAVQATPYYDEVVTGLFPQDVPPHDTYDCVVFNDVLEHLVDPWAALEATTPMLRPGGTVVASIPNVRALRVLLNLVVRGDWEYRELGILDRTHLRFFTKRSMVRLFEEAGYEVVSAEGIFPLGSRWHLAPVLTRLLCDIAYLEFVVVARPKT